MSQNIYSLAQLQAMTREDFIQFFPQKRAKWITRGYKVDATRLIKAIIMATTQLHYPLTDNRGCREIWYNPVKSILLRAIGKRVEDPHKNYMGLFDGILSNMVKEGLLKYADLGINDFRTLRELYETIEKAECWKNILLFVEKDSAYVHLQPLQNLFNINIMSGSGWSNTAGIEKILRNLAENGITEVVVFTLTDYDPFGFAIAKEFVDKCKTLGLYVTEQHRIGINVEHATPEILDVQKYPIKRGRRLSVNGIRFDSDRWLAEYGIDRQYGLEIEAVSAQPGGHQFLREIVAKELLRYLNETDRVEEITKEVWENAPFRTIHELIYSIDGSRAAKDDILWCVSNAPVQLPKEYLSYEEFSRRYSPIHERMEEATSDITEEIDDLQGQLYSLEEEKEESEEPYREKIRKLQNNYALSRRILIYCLWRYYTQNKEKWPRKHYTLGFPKDCLVKAIQGQKDLAGFIKQVDDNKIVTDILSVFKDAMSNGEIQRLISETLNGGSSGE